MKHIEVSTNNEGLSFATNMKKFKKLIKTKARFHTEVDIYAAEEFIFLTMDGFKIVYDRPGDASLTVTKRATVKTIAGRMRIAP